MLRWRIKTPNQHRQSNDGMEVKTENSDESRTRTRTRRIFVAVSYGFLTPRVEHAGKDDFLGLPDQRHGHGEWQQGDNQDQAEAKTFEQEHDNIDGSLEYAIFH